MSVSRSRPWCGCNRFTPKPGCTTRLGSLWGRTRAHDIRSSLVRCRSGTRLLLMNQHSNSNCDRQGCSRRRPTHCSREAKHWQTKRSFSRFFLNIGTRESDRGTAARAPAQVIDHAISLRRTQRALGKSREQVRCRMLSGDFCPQPLLHDFIKTVQSPSISDGHYAHSPGNSQAEAGHAPSVLPLGIAAPGCFATLLSSLSILNGQESFSCAHVLC